MAHNPHKALFSEFISALASVLHSMSRMFGNSWFEVVFRVHANSTVKGKTIEAIQIFKFVQVSSHLPSTICLSQMYFQGENDINRKLVEYTHSFHFVIVIVKIVIKKQLFTIIHNNIGTVEEKTLARKAVEK